MSTSTPRGDAPRPDLLTISDVADLLNLSRDTVHRLVRRGHLAPYRLPNGRPRFRRDDVLALLTRDEAS